MSSIRKWHASDFDCGHRFGCMRQTDNPELVTCAYCKAKQQLIVQRGEDQ